MAVSVKAPTPMAMAATMASVGSVLVTQVDATSGTFVAAPDDPLPEL
jgi:hypothetical protein